MKRKITAALALTLVIALLAGCSSKPKHPFGYDLSKYVTLGKYTGIEYEYTAPEVTEADVTVYVNDKLSAKGYGETKEITDRPVQTGDTVNIAFVGKRDGVAFEGGTSDSYDLVIGSHSFIDGFEDGLIGAKVGETRTLDLTFPDPYPNDPNLSGAPVQFEVTVHTIKSTVYPALTDELAAEISDFGTAEEFLNDARTQVAATKAKNAESQKESDVWNKIIENCTYGELPKKEIEVYTEKLRESYERQIQSTYQVSTEEYLKQVQMSTEEFESGLTEQATQAVKNYMTVIAIGRDQDLLPTEDEYTKELENYATQNGYKTIDEFKAAIDEDQFYLSIVIDKVMDFVVENAVEKSAQ